MFAGSLGTFGKSQVSYEDPTNIYETIYPPLAGSYIPAEKWQRPVPEFVVGGAYKPFQHAPIRPLSSSFHFRLIVCPAGIGLCACVDDPGDRPVLGLRPSP